LKNLDPWSLQNFP